MRDGNCFTCSSEKPVSTGPTDLGQPQIEVKTMKTFITAPVGLWPFSLPHLRVTSPSLLDRYRRSLNWRYSAFWNSPMTVLLSPPPNLTLCPFFNDFWETILCFPVNFDCFLKIAWSEATNLPQQKVEINTWKVRTRLNIWMFTHISWCLFLMSKLFHIRKRQIHSTHRLKSLAQENPIPSSTGQFYSTKIISTMTERTLFFHLTSSS